jgi:AraC family L-rhamnose operon transcriptional activator RhaR
VRTLTNLDIDGDVERISRDRAYARITREAIFGSRAPAYAAVQHIRYGPGVTNPHSVDFVQVVVIISGTGQHVSARGVVPMGPGSVIVLRPGAWEAAMDCDIEIALLGISHETLAADLAFLRSRPVLRDLLYSSARAVGGVRHTAIDPTAVADFTREVRRLERLLRRRPDGLLMVLGQIVTTIGVLSLALPGSEEDAPMHPAIDATLERLESNPERDWRLADLAQGVNLDPSYLGRIFRGAIGVSPLTYLAHLRVERATALLAESPMSMTQIGAAVGWPDASLFSRRFRDLMGVAPSRYRDAVRRRRSA